MTGLVLRLWPVLFVLGCKCGDDQALGAAPPPVESAPASLCAQGGPTLVDPVAAPLLPKQFASFCLDPNAEVRAYGKQAKATIEQICTELFDGDCELYRGFGLERVVSARYLDGSRPSSIIGVTLSRFDSQLGALGFFARRVVGDQDPASITHKPFSAGALAALGSTVAVMIKGQYVAELFYSNEEEAPAALTASSARSLPPLAQALSQALPGDNQWPKLARQLPTEGLVPLSVAYQARDGLSIPGVGPAVSGSYARSGARFVVMLMERPNPEAAEDVMKTLRRGAGSREHRGATAKLVQLSVRSTESGPKAEWVFGARGAFVLGIGDEERALTSADAGAPGGQLSLEQKREELERLLTALSASEPSPSGAEP